MVDAVGATQRLHRILLAWDYWDINEKLDEEGGVFDKLTPVPTTFTSMKEYHDVFEPLLLEECCAQILRGMEEGEVLAPHPSAVAAFEMTEAFLTVTFVVEAGVSELYNDNDLLLISKDDPYSDDPNVQLHLLGFLESHSGSQGLVVKCLVSDESQAGNVRGTQRVRAMRAGLQTKQSTWHLLKLSNMSTITREWIALQHAHLCPFADILLSGKPRALHESRHMDIPPGMRAVMDAQCNVSQMDALKAGLDGTPVVLIQGPPGTGKTRTILNLLSVVMHSAHKGALALEVRAAKAAAASGCGGASSGLGEDDKMRLWARQAPWLLGKLSPRDVVRPEPNVPVADMRGNDFFGLLRRAAPIAVTKNAGPKAHVLVCAPSNSALDEIVIRIMKSGLMDASGNMYSPSVVRVGVNVHHSTRSVALDSMLNARLGEQGGGAVKGPERDRMRIAILDEASIVCSTLSFAGSAMFYRLSRRFDVVVIDEAAQAVEPSLLVPLVMGCKQVYLVGDPVQLPATVISRRALEYKYDNSLFKRMQLAGYPVKILDTQYRMHPAISSFPSLHFYGGRLLDGDGIAEATQQPWHMHKSLGPFAFYDVHGKESSPAGSASVQNKAEAQMVLCVYRELVHRFPDLRRSPSVGIISPYKSQVKLLRDSFKQALGEEGARVVDINTVDGFQGREKDIILFSCVRSLKKGRRPGSIGFVADERRINVGLTRARSSLIVIGHARALQCNGNWAGLIHSAMVSGAFYRPTPPYAEWVAAAAEGVQPGSAAAPVQPSKEELAKLEKVRDHLLQKAATHAVQQDEDEEHDQEEEPEYDGEDEEEDEEEEAGGSKSAADVVAAAGGGADGSMAAGAGVAAAAEPGQAAKSVAAAAAEDAGPDAKAGADAGSAAATRGRGSGSQRGGAAGGDGGSGQGDGAGSAPEKGGGGGAREKRKGDARKSEAKGSKRSKH